MRGLLGAMIGVAFLVSTTAIARPPKKTEAERRADFQRVVQSNYGKDINDLIRRLGPPQSQYQMPNHHIIYTWNRSAPSFVCLMNFEADEQNVIVSATGDGCY
jgi:hypothetical protein